MSSIRPKVIFMGTPDFSVPALQALIEADDIDVVAVYSQPPRPAGRGQSLRLSPVHQCAVDHDIPVENPKNFKVVEDVAKLASYAPDLAVVAAYGLILPQSVLDVPAFGCLNIHASLLPRWRGAAPIQRAIAAGDKKTGIGIMKMEAGLDTGPVMMQEAIQITPDMTGGVLHDALSDLGASMIVPAVRAVFNNQAHFKAQSQEGITYAHKLDKTEGFLDFREDADKLARKIRAFTPWPGCYTNLIDGKRLKILEAVALDLKAPAGSLVEGDALIIGCGQGALKCLKVQPQSKAPMDGASFLNGQQNWQEGQLVLKLDDSEA